MKSMVMIFLAVLSSAAVAESGNSCMTSNGSITTMVQAEAKATFLHTVQHHWKFKFWRGAVCWGKPDDQYQDSQEFKDSSKECTGKINFNTSRGNQLNYTPMTLSWGANMTDGDTFSIDLNDTRVRAVYDSVGGDCTSHRWATKMDKANVTYETKAVINVPEDVWVVQVRANAQISPGSNLTELNPRIGRVALKNDEDPKAWLQPLTDTWTYLYVEPGEQLELDLSYANQGLDGAKKYNVRYDFKFIGHNRCVEVIGDPKTLNYADAFKKQILSPVTTEEEYHNYAVKLGCLRNPAFLKAGMNNSGPDALVPALEALNQHTQKVISQAVENKTGVYAGPYLATILDMSLVDMSRFALTDLLNYCKTYRDFRRETLKNPNVTQVAGIEFMMLTYSHLEMIYKQLATQSLATLTNNVQSWNKMNVTYAQLFDGSGEAQKALTAYQQSMIQMGLAIYPTISAEISTNIPQVEVNKTAREQLLADLQKAKTLANSVNTSIRQMLRNFGRRSNDVVEAGQLSTNVQHLLDLHAKIGNEMHEYFKFFISADQGGDNGDRFVKYLATIQTEILRPSAENLSAISQLEKLKSLDEKFVRRSELNKLNDDVNACIFNPYGGGQ